MKVQYMLSLQQIRAISLLAHIDGKVLITVYEDGRRVVEYDITLDQKSMLNSLLGQKGIIIKDKPQWPSRGDEYYYIDSNGDILKDHWDIVYDGTPSCVDADRHDMGNVFKTEVEAEFERERLKVLNQLKSLSDDDQEWDGVNQHYYIEYDTADNKFEAWANVSAKLPYLYYFKSEESALAVIKIIGEDKLKKYVFCVEE